MNSDDSAKKAIEELDRAEYDGKVITVSIAKPKTEGSRPRTNGGSFGDKSRDRGNGGGRRW